MTIGGQDVYLVILLEGLINVIYPDAPWMNINLHKQNVLGPSCTISPHSHDHPSHDADEHKKTAKLSLFIFAHAQLWRFAYDV